MLEGWGAHQQLPCSPLLGKELSAFFGDKLGAWGTV